MDPVTAHITSHATHKLSSEPEEDGQV